MFHAQSLASMGLDQANPNSMEAQLCSPEGCSQPGTTMNLCTPGTHYHNMEGDLVTEHCRPSYLEGAQLIVGLEWISVDLIALGDSIIHHVVEGDTVLTYQGPVLDNEEPLTKGYISLQSEGDPFGFRNIKIVELLGCTDPEAGNYQPYYVKEKNPSDCTDPAGVSFKAGQNPDGNLIRYSEKTRQVQIKSPVAHKITVQDISGRILFESRGAAGSEVNYQLGEYLELHGFYFIKVESGKKTSMRKVFVI
jgi:hypothetical protein